MNDIAQCSATRLFNGVHNWYSDKSNGEWTATTGDLTSVDEGTTAIIGTVRQEEAMDGIIVQEESVDMGDCDDEEQTQDDIDKMPHFTTENPWKISRKLMIEKN